MEFIEGQWLSDELEDHALDDSESTSDRVDVSDQWEYTDWTMVVTPEIVKSDGQLIVKNVDHDEIDTILLTDGIPCATYRIRFIGGNGRFGVGEIDTVLAPPTENDTFRLGVDTTTDHDITVNESLIEPFKSELPTGIRVTLELEIVAQQGAIGARLSNPGIAPFEGAILPAKVSENGQKATIQYDHESIPETVVDTRMYDIDIEQSPPKDSFFVEIIETTARDVTGKVVEKSPSANTVDPHLFEFTTGDAAINDAYIYFCGVYENDDESICQDFYSQELFGSSSETNTSAGEMVLLKDYKRDFNHDSDSELYGPFIAVTDEEENIEPDAWDRRFQYQVEVTWDELYMLPVAELDVDIGKKKSISGSEARRALKQLTTEGTPIEIGSDGTTEEHEEGPTEPESLTPDDDDDTDDDQPVDGDAVDRLTTIHMAKNLCDPLPVAEVLKDAPDPGTQLLRPAYDGELRPELYERALAHLVGGKNVIFYGPPGSGKTRIAERLGHAMCSTLHIEAANAEWTYQEVVGGFTPSGSGGFKPTRGVLTEAAAACQNALDEYENPDWLLIDELNRANLDEAFGDVFTLLDLDHRSDSKITFADGQSQAVPMAFRILGTMNTEDQAQLFALGYAFRRRFGFMEVPPAYENPTNDTVPTATIDDLNIKPNFQKLLPVLEQAVVAHFDDTTPEDALADTPTDTKMGIPPLTSVVDSDTIYDTAVDAISPNGAELEFPSSILWFVQTLTDNDVADIGQGILIDAIRFVLAHYVLFPSKTDWRAVDHAVTAYILPQLEAYTSELRRAETVAAESDAITNFEAVLEAAEEIGFAQTADGIEAALDSHEILR